VTSPTLAQRAVPHGVHLVGSVPLPGAEHVFRAAAHALGPYLSRIPDGETGERSAWAAFQVPRLAQNPAFEARAAPLMRLVLRGYGRSRLVRRLVNAAAGRVSKNAARRPTLLRLRPGVRPDQVRLDPLGYATAARDSYRIFRRLKDESTIPSHVRFQVSLPTPIAVITNFPLDQQRFLLPAYEARLCQEIDEMLAVIPPDQLAIQWDAAVEFALLEGIQPSVYGSPAASRQPLVDTLVRLGNNVPPTVELGYHLCYGDSGHKHFKEPENTSRLVDVTNAIAASLQRDMHWVHFPVPVNRFDDAYYAHLRELRVAPETEVYAGLVHDTDGVAGTRRRIEAAQRALHRDFGIATECGLGRRDPRTIPALLALHAQLAAPVQPQLV